MSSINFFDQLIAGCGPVRRVEKSRAHADGTTMVSDSYIDSSLRTCANSGLLDAPRHEPCDVMGASIGASHQ